MKRSNVLHFKSKAGYKKYLAYGHIRNLFHGRKRIYIRGKFHKVIH